MYALRQYADDDVIAFMGGVTTTPSGFGAECLTRIPSCKFSELSIAGLRAIGERDEIHARQVVVRSTVRHRPLAAKHKRPR